MRDFSVPDLRAAVNGVIAQREPQFKLVYRRSLRRTWLLWCLVGLVALAVVIGVFVVLKPAPRMTFHDQVSAFVDLVYRD